MKKEDLKDNKQKILGFWRKYFSCKKRKYFLFLQVFCVANRQKIKLINKRRSDTKSPRFGMQSYI